MITGTIPGRWTQPATTQIRRTMSSEHAIEKVHLSDIREGDMVQDPTSGRWIKVIHTADDTASGPHRVYYGDGGEEIDSRYVTGLVNRQVRD